jgi:plasmid stabilization system protein ParE
LSTAAIRRSGSVVEQNVPTRRLPRTDTHNSLREGSLPAACNGADARDCWVENRDKAPTAFDDDLADLVELLGVAPHWVGARVAQRPGVRRVLLRRVRYYVYFTIADPTVTIVAVWHARRGTLPP